MILTDTTVVIDFLRAPTVHLVKIIQTNQAAICGATLSEVYAGARSSADFKKYDKVLSVFSLLPTRKKTWPNLGRNLAALGSKGITVPFPDALIATIGIENDIEVWARDPHFPMMQKVLPQLKLFLEPLAK
jgi:predicted nucleic acid-binding protein